ncbi:MAG: hypothetical protein M3O15_12595 [Acidobacteriota bacterium]|nr:hypothetical protein [Acidobacteriota bacterium]
MEAPGIQQLVHGLALAHADDRDPLFDDLYESFRGRPPRRATSNLSGAARGPSRQPSQNQHHREK